MPTRQTRIFAPFALPYNNDNNDTWAETLIGRVVQPATAEFDQLEWFWFSRYVQDAHGSSGDCNLADIPAGFVNNGTYRSVRFRYSVPNQSLEPFEQRIEELVNAADCFISDCRNYGPLDDLASKRFVGDEYTMQRRTQRVALMTAFLCATSRLFLDTLTGPDQDGRFAQEANDDILQNPNRNTFESIHHLFCNMTNVPTDVLVAEPVIGTRMYSAEGVSVRPVRVRF
jgi:hypothetical protein